MILRNNFQLDKHLTDNQKDFHLTIHESNTTDIDNNDGDTDFKNFKLDGSTVDWNNEIGFAPEYLYKHGVAV